MFINIFINLCAVSFFCGILVFIFNLQRRLKYDRQRYKLFAIRDNLYRLAVTGKVDQNSEEYKFTEGLISTSINAVKNYDIFLLLKVLKDFDKLEEKIKKHQTLYDKIKSHKQLASVYKEFTCQTMTILRENSFCVKLCFIGFELGLLGRRHRQQTKFEDQPSINLYRGFAQWNARFV